ncbi:glycosyltransferase family 4 protein [Conexivisphaera calida]|uniref:Glycosyl transferase family 1 domain-containing protein n=1 Tax=Conexivisphaera calida TaxID=1874277 RepID=A0A4P2VHS3_9ARCH|nr:glycosyltransferase family 4 protein [Conexivisphaera calida]BBE42752.1 398aa long conserved hypothetical protein [Conexivisphaera calida]
MAVFTYADTLTGGNLRLIRALTYYPRDFFALLIPSDRLERLAAVMRSVGYDFPDYLREAVPLRPMGAPRNPLDFFRYGKYVGEVARRNGAELLFLYHEHVYFPFGFRASGMRWTMLLQQTPVIGSLVVEGGRGFDLFRRNYREIYGYGAARSLKGYLRLKAFDWGVGDAELIAASRSVPYELEWLGIRKRLRMLEIGSGVDGCARRSGVKDHDVAYFARVVREKGIFDFLNALSLMRGKARNAYIIGFADDAMKNVVEAELRRRRLDFVETVFNAKKEEAHEALSRSKVLMYPSKMDAFSLSLMESLSCGTPAVAYAIPGIRFNYNTPAVRFVAPLDYRSLAEETVRILEEGSWEEMGREGIRYAQRYTWEEMAKQEVDALKMIMNSS